MHPMGRHWVAASCCFVASWFAPGVGFGQSTWYVDAAATVAGTGTSWGDAFTTLHAALAVATAGDNVRIAQGTYTPDVGHPLLPVGSRSAYWSYVGGVRVEGGYRGGAGGGAPDDRDTSAFATILSGEIGDPTLLTDNSLTLLRADVGGEILLDGLTLTRVYQDLDTLPQGHYGAALWTFGSTAIDLHDLRIIDNTIINDTQVGRGGVVFIFDTPGTVTDCEFRANHIGGTQFQTVGAALFIWESDIHFSDCTFEDNVNDASAGAAYGAGVYIEHGFPVFERVTFRNNEATSAGGAVFHRNAWDPVNQPTREGAPTFVDCLFEDNASNQGGAAFIWSRRPDDVATFINTRFIGNQSLQNGAAILSNGGGTTVMQVRIEGCLFAGNESGAGFTQSGNAFDGPGAQVTIAHCTFADNVNGRALQLASFPAGDYLIANSILRNNGTGSLSPSSTSGVITASIVQGAAQLPAGIVQVDVVDTSPLFLDPAAGDYRLSPASPAIDTGNDVQTPAALTVDLDGAPRLADGDGDCLERVDLGAYEAADACAGATFRRGDVNLDGARNIADAVYLLGNLFPGPGGPNAIDCQDSADGNDDGAANIADVVAILGSLFGVPAVPLPPPFTGCGSDPTVDSLGCADDPTCP
ncbi:MAG: right-handed parallel beta-helix repeat-containing protein [Planctomycetota bacterium]